MLRTSSKFEPVGLLYLHNDGNRHSDHKIEKDASQTQEKISTTNIMDGNIKPGTHGGINQTLKLLFKCSECGQTFNNINIYITHIKLTHQSMSLPTNEQNVNININTGNSPRNLVNTYTMEASSKNVTNNYSMENISRKTCTTDLNLNNDETEHDVDRQIEHTGLYKDDVASNTQQTKPDLSCGILYKCNAQEDDEHHLEYPQHTKKNKRIKFCCKTCDKTFVKQTSLMIHERAHKASENKQFSCDVCGKKFIKSSSLKIHANMHQKRKPYKCKICGESYSIHITFIKHQATHKEQDHYKCDDCGKLFTDAEAFLCHGKKHKGTTKMYRCQLCGKQLSNQRNFFMHKYFHERQKKFSCFVCKKVFITSNGLRMHQNVHTFQNKYCCDVCGKQFFNKPPYERHIKRPHVPVNKPNESDLSDKYKCNECDIVLKDLDLYNRHKQTHQRNTIFNCDICKKTFPRSFRMSHYAEHIREVEKPYYKCDGCDRCFISKKGLKKHSQIHIGEKHLNLECNICGLLFGTLNNLQRHSYKIHTDKKPYKCDVIQSNSKIHTDQNSYYKCDVCDRHFSDKYHLKRHSRIHTGDKPYKCDVCKKEFITKYECNVHNRLHIGYFPYKCDLCDKAFIRSSALSSHKKSHHKEKSTYICDACHEEFTELKDLRRHLKIHTKPKAVPKVKCEICGKLLSKRSLKYHMISHTGIKPYQCDECGKEFMRSCLLMFHKVCHSNLTQYECNECGRKFKRKAGLNNHKQRIHSGERPCVCDTCGKTFSTPDSLKLHQRLHTGERPYHCKLCDKTYTTSAHLTKHMKDIHKALKGDKKPIKDIYKGDKKHVKDIHKGDKKYVKDIHKGDKKYVKDTHKGDKKPVKDIHKGE